MTEQELRAIVREAIARHAAGGAGTAAGHPHDSILPVRQHPSHGLLPVLAGSDTDGPCLIEPGVACNHCGYCKSYGH